MKLVGAGAMDAITTANVASDIGRNTRKLAWEEARRVGMALDQSFYPTPTPPPRSRAARRVRRRGRRNPRYR